VFLYSGANGVDADAESGVFDGRGTGQTHTRVCWPHTAAYGTATKPAPEAMFTMLRALDEHLFDLVFHAEPNAVRLTLRVRCQISSS